MEYIFYYFLSRSVDGTRMANPYITFDFLGDINGFVELDGVGYYIDDFAIEPAYKGE